MASLETQEQAQDGSVYCYSSTAIISRHCHKFTRKTSLYGTMAAARPNEVTLQLERMPDAKDPALRQGQRDLEASQELNPLHLLLAQHERKRNWDEAAAKLDRLGMVRSLSARVFVLVESVCRGGPWCTWG